MNFYFFIASILFLAFLLFFPVSRLLWVFSIRWAARRRGGTLSPREITRWRTGTRIVTAPLVLLVSWLFTLQLLARLHG